MSSDSTGEIYVLTKEDGSGVADVSRATTANGTNPSPSQSVSAPKATGGSGGVRAWMVGGAGYLVAGVAVVGALV